MSVRSKKYDWKIEFPSLIGLPAAQAMIEIKTEFPKFHIVICRPGDEVCENFCETRVYLVVDHMDRVCGVPENG